MSIIPTAEEMQANVRDAERWRALLASGRIRVLGSAGFDFTYPTEPKAGTDYLHFGMEFWTDHTSTNGTAEAREMLTNYADFLVNRKTNK